MFPGQWSNDWRMLLPMDSANLAFYNSGQPGAVPNAVGMRPVGMQQRPQLTGFPNQQMMARGGALGLPRTEMFGLPQRPQMVGQNQMMVPNPSMMPGNFQHMVKINAPQQGLVQIGTSSGPNSVQGPIPSPAGGHMGPGSGGAPMPSPGSVLQSASPGPHSIAPSPANRTSTGIPSPGNLNTPGELRKVVFISRNASDPGTLRMVAPALANLRPSGILSNATLSAGDGSVLKMLLAPGHRNISDVLRMLSHSSGRILSTQNGLRDASLPPSSNKPVELGKGVLPDFLSMPGEVNGISASLVNQRAPSSDEKNTSDNLGRTSTTDDDDDVSSRDDVRAKKDFRQDEDYTLCAGRLK